MYRGKWQSHAKPDVEVRNSKSLNIDVIFMFLTSPECHSWRSLWVAYQRSAKLENSGVPGMEHGHSLALQNLSAGGWTH